MFGLLWKCHDLANNSDPVGPERLTPEEGGIKLNSTLWLVSNFPLLMTRHISIYVHLSDFLTGASKAVYLLADEDSKRTRQRDSWTSVQATNGYYAS